MSLKPSELNVPLDKRLRMRELLLVMAVSFLGIVITSLYSLFSGAHYIAGGTQRNSIPGILNNIIRQATTLALLIYVLSQQGRGLRQIGLAWRSRDVLWSVILFFVASFLTWLWEWTLYYGVYWLTGHVPDMRSHNLEFLSTADTGGGFALLLVFGLINPFHEELIARAYLMSEVQALTGRTGLAVLLSVALQVCYHFYQGFWAALTYVPLFLSFALYYVKTRRILPVILAHLYFDQSALLFHR